MGSPRASSAADTVRWTTTLDDLVDGSHLTAVGLRRIVTVVGVLAVAWGVYTLVSGDVVFGLFLSAYAVLTLGMIYFRPLERVIVGWQARPLLGRECEVATTAGGVAIRQGTARGVLAWVELTGIREDARTILLVAGRAARFGIPKRAFDSPAAADAFRDEVLARVAAAAEAASR
ncbi:MAG: YcxB family protein [Chloroflexota bacterium]